MPNALARSSLLTAGTLVLRVVTQAAALTLSARLLGPHWYGVIAAAASLAILLGIVPNVGAGLVVIARARRQADAAAEMWRYAWPQHLVLGPTVSVVYVFAANHLTSGQLGLIAIMCIAVSEIVVTPISQQLSALLQAIDRVPLSQFVLLMGLAIRVLGLAACFVLPLAPPTAYAASQLAASVAGLALALAVTRRHVSLGGQPRMPRRDELRDGAAYSATSLIAANSMEIDKIIAVRVVSTHDAGLYASMSRIVSAGTLPIIGLMMSAQPQLFHKGAERAPETARLISHLALACLILGLLGALGLRICAPLLPIIMGTRFEEMISIVPIMAWVIPAMSLRLGGTNVMLTLGRPSGRLIFDLCGAALLTGSMWWGGATHGIQGLAFAVLASEGVLATVAWAIVYLEVRRGPAAKLARP